MTSDERRKIHSRFYRHAGTLMWKSYLQRQRRWRILLAETIFASIVFTAAVFIAKPVFLTPLRAEPEPPLTTSDLLASINQQNIIGFAPSIEPYVSIMEKAARSLQIPVTGKATEYDLNNMLYQIVKGSPNPIDRPVIWVIWQPKVNNMWKFSIRSTERARYETASDVTSYPNPHLRAGFLAVQLAISRAILEHSSAETPNYELKLVAMPVSPLMQESKVRRALSGILLCFTLALIPPVLETEALVVYETISKFKRSLRLRDVGYSSMYLGWLVYAYLTALPICFLSAITLILIFRWIHLLPTLIIVFAYVTVMIMMALIMAMFHSKAWIACVWSSLFTLLQTYLAELLVHHEFDMKHGALTFLLQVLLPPLGFVHALNQFALLQTGRGGGTADHSLFYSLGSWTVLIVVYFGLLMLLQRTIGQERAIGGQVTWTSIIFKKIEDVNQLKPIENPTGRERDNLQEVDELVAKAVSFQKVSKSIMGVEVLSNITMDIYRGEFTMLFAERVQEKMIITIEDLLTGLTFADKGSIHILGHPLKPGKNYITVPYMMGYCHRTSFLIPDLTVQEHFKVFTEICLWQETKQYISEYGHIRSKRLIEECDLSSVRHEQIRHIDAYYRTQLCWALAMLLEPRVVMIPNFTDQHPRFVMVMKDKIMKYRKIVTLIKLCFSSTQLEYADRVFVFDTKILAFGGTPAYMFFKYGREYRVRMTIRSDSSVDDEATAELLRRSAEGGATVRAHLGSLLILRVPASPTEAVAKLVKDLMENANKYGLTSMNISVPDSEEVYRRAITESRAAIFEAPEAHQMSKLALKRISESVTWHRRVTVFSNITHLRNIGWKYFSCYIHYRLYFIITILSAFLAGIFIGLSFSATLGASGRDAEAKILIHGERLTLESFGQKTTLVVRSDNSPAARNLAHAYVLSEPNITKKEMEHITYTALSHTEVAKSLKEYLVIRAIDSPQLYVYMYAYGMDVDSGITDGKEFLRVNVLYSPLHYDYGAAARSLAKVYSALLRHYTGTFNASIQVTDDPLALDLTPWIKHSTRPPFLIQFLLILSISHITLIPSMEHGLVRHLQSHAMNFSPARYWLTLYFWDLILHWILVILMTGVMLAMMILVAPTEHFYFGDLLVVPFTLIVYGFACVPQAYLFGLGPRVTLNTMTFIIVNVVFGETTIIAKIFYGKVLNYALVLMSLSPQFNMAYAFVKIKQIFLYNSECIIFKTQNLCSNKILHKCCQKCGVLQKCFVKRNYLTQDPGILREVCAMTIIAFIFMGILLLLEYKIIQRICKKLISRWIPVEKTTDASLMTGAGREKIDVLEKVNQIQKKRTEKVDTFGDYLLARNITKKDMGFYILRNIYLGLGRGEVLALSGLKRHGRLRLVEILAGLKLPSHGQAWCMSKWNQETNPHKYARQISLSCEQEPLPPWMTVYDALEMLALLRGVPKKYIRDELKNLIEALDIRDQVDTLICRITQKTERARLHFAAAVIGAPPIIMLDECTAYQKFSVRRAMYCLLQMFRKRGHGIFISSSSVETHMPLTNRLAIMLDGTIHDIDTVDNLVGRYSNKGYTIVVHLKDEVNVVAMFKRYFKQFVINDSTDVLVNVQVFDSDLNWETIFERMESLKNDNQRVYSYIITVIPIDYVYNSILNSERGNMVAGDIVSGYRLTRKVVIHKIKPKMETLQALRPFEPRYDITKLKELPWSVIFHT